MRNCIVGFLKANLVNLIVFILCFLGVFLLLASQWIKNHFETNDFGIILFHLRFPLLGNGVPLIASFLFYVIFISFLIAFCVAWANLSMRFVRFVCNFITNLIGKISDSKITTFKVIFAIVLFALCTNIVINRFHIKNYLHIQTQYSQLYEEHYKYFDLANLKTFTPNQNLIIMLVESLESNLTSQVTQNRGGGILT